MMDNWLILDETLKKVWEDVAGKLACEIYGKAVTVTLTLPTLEKATKARKDNLGLWGTLSVEPSGEKTVESQIRLPYNGVFIAHSEKQGVGQCFVWNNWLGECEGWRLIRPNGAPEKSLDDLICRIGYSSGGCVDVATLHRQTKRKTSKLGKDQLAIGDYVVNLKEGFSKEFTKHHPDLSTEVSTFVRDQLTKGLETVVQDQEDLAHRQLITFPRWLLQAFKRRLTQIKEGKKSDFGGIVPLALLAGTDPKKAKGMPALLRVYPLNAVELQARIYGVRRRKLSHRTVELLSSIHRGNHSSFAGRLCPFETPESEQVGLMLSLARGACVNEDGSIASAPLEDVSSCLSWSSGLIPFAHCNDGVRNMMGAKNLRQATPVKGRAVPSVKTGVEAVLGKAVADYVHIGICPDTIDEHGNLALGRDLLVAYMPWYGWNVDDAIVVSESAAQHLAYVERKHVRRGFAPGWTTITDITKTKKLNAWGDYPLEKGDVIVELRSLRGQTYRVRYQDPAPAVLKNFVWHAASSRNDFEPVLEYDLEKMIPLGEGDKLMGRHGNKGVVSRVLPDKQMPKLPARGQFPETTVDVILNPHGILSRKAPAQLLETHLGYLFHHGVKESAVLVPSLGDTSVGAPRRDAVNHAVVKKLLKENGLDEHGAISLMLPDGGSTAHPIVVGYQHVVRLHHVPELKSLARRGGPGAHYDAASGQAVRGRAAGGGQRLGEMEVWALAAHGADDLLEEMLGAKSDRAWAQSWHETSGMCEGADVPSGDMFTGFPGVLRDWLLACGINLEYKDGNVSFKTLSAEDIKARIDDGHRVFSAHDFWERRVAKFACSKERCAWKLPGGEYLFSDNRLRLADFLQKHSFSIGGPLMALPEEDHYEFGLVQKGVLCGRAHLELLDYAAEKGLIRAQLTFLAEGHLAELAKSHPRLTLVLRHTMTDSEKKEVKKFNHFWTKGELPADWLLASLMDEAVGTDWIGDMVLTCPHGHTSDQLKPQPPFERTYEPIEGGFFDPKIFADGAFGRIDLPFPVKVDEMGLSFECLPVLPTKYRQPRRKGERDRNGLTQAYVDILDAVRLYEDEGNQDRSSTAERITQGVTTLFSRISSLFNRKKGILRRQGLGRRVDRSTRLVAVPDPELDWNQVGMPPSILEELIGDLVRKVQVPVDLMDGTKTVELETGWSFHQVERGTAERQVLADYLEKQGNILAVLNRQPSLHRDSIQSFHPVPVSHSDAQVMRVSPLCCRGFGLDFDGDEIVAHLPVSARARGDAAKLLPENNLLSLASGEILAHYDRDLVSGLELLYRDGFANLKPEIQALFASCCQVCFDERRLPPGEFGKKILDHLLREHQKDAVLQMSALARAAFDCCTRHGMSFGFYDLLDEGTRDGNRAIALMTESGANGQEQLPADIELSRGMSWKQLFENSKMARESLCEKKLGSSRSGGLTRQLVLALWPIRISEADCGATGERSIATCASKNGICAVCYGAGHENRHANGKTVAVGDPVGLWAAQSIGERGTQLTMKTIHGGEAAKKLDMGLVRRLCFSGKDGERDFFDGVDAPKNAQAFAERFKAEKAYARLDDRHFAVLWRTLNDAPEHKLLAQKKKDSEDVLKIVSGDEQLQTIVDFAKKNCKLPLDSPFLRVLFNWYGRRAQNLARQEENQEVCNG